MSGNLIEYGLYMALTTYLKLWMVDWGNGSQYEYGISDWSGNFMNVRSLVNLYEMESHLKKKGVLVLN